MKFNVGDRIICINNKDNHILNLNQQYVVTKVLTYVNRICILNYERKSFYVHRFELDKLYYRKVKLKQLRNGI